MCVKCPLKGHCAPNTTFFFFIYEYRLKFFEILFELEDLNDNDFNGVPIYTIPPLNRSDTDQNNDKVIMILKKIVCAVSVRLAVSNERLLLWIKQTTNIHLKPFVLQEQLINHFGLKVLSTACEGPTGGL